MSNRPQPTHDTIKARLLRIANPGFGYCLRCGMPWSHVHGHTTNYTPSRGCFPLCESCWTELGCPEARISYYKTMIDRWDGVSEVTEQEKRDIMMAVARGL